MRKKNCSERNLKDKGGESINLGQIKLPISEKKLRCKNFIKEKRREVEVRRVTKNQLCFRSLRRNWRKNRTEVITPKMKIHFDDKNKPQSTR